MKFIIPPLEYTFFFIIVWPLCEYLLLNFHFTIDVSTAIPFFVFLLDGMPTYLIAPIH